MRPGTAIVLLGLILLFAYFGWAAFGIIALSVVIFLLLGAAAVVVGLWVIQRRMRKKVEELGKAMEREMGAAFGRTEQRRSREDAIDVEGHVRKPRDGADDPDALDPRGPR
jgi:membrane protein implicated in regulation of membrane protease activity